MYSKRELGRQDAKPHASNVAAVWTPNVQETLINGVLQGRKQSDERGASAVSRIRVWRMVVEIAALVGPVMVERALVGSRYEELKEGSFLEVRRRVKAEMREVALAGWVRNGGDDFRLNTE